MKRLNRIRHSLFFNQVKTMLTGTAIGQLIMIGTIPIMARLFTPADLAFYAILVALSGLSSVGASLRFELTIILPKDDEKADKLFVFCLQSILITTIILLTVLLLASVFKNYLPLNNSLSDISLFVFFGLFFIF